MTHHTDKQQIRLSKFLSLVLRHKPEHIGLTLDPQGWVDIDVLIARSASSGMPFAQSELLALVRASDKQRFSVSADGLRSRAAQGHSVGIELGLEPSTPPVILFHGTASKNLDAILAVGLRPQSRVHVHLSADSETAHRVGARHGKPVVLQVASGPMHDQGYKFFRADNGVWLCDAVPPQFLSPTEPKAY